MNKLHSYLQQNLMYEHRAAAFFTTNFDEGRGIASVDEIAENAINPPVGTVYDLLTLLYEREKIEIDVWFTYMCEFKSREVGEELAREWAHHQYENLSGIRVPERRAEKQGKLYQLFQ